jgi:3-oxoacyl-[acyl-carrier-protein] synthase-3
MLRRLKLPDTVQVARTITRLGNTSATSIPLALASLYRANQIQPNAVALIVGFGAGLVYAGQTIILPDRPFITATDHSA